MGEVRVLVLAVLLRVFIFNSLLLLTCVLDGMPNFNSTVLMLFIIFVIPLPHLEPVLFILDEIYAITIVYLRVVHKLFSWIYSLVLLPFLMCLSPIFRWLLRRYSLFSILCRSVLPLFKAMVILLVPSLIRNVLISVAETMVVVPLLWARYFAILLFTVVALIIALPSPVSVLNYIVTGYGYPGSTIRFHYCPAIRKTNILSYLFLEISYPLWNITRTLHFYLFSKYLFHGSWNIEINIKDQIGPGYTTWLMGYSRMFCVGLVTPFVLPFQCFEQILNNILCTVCHVAFLTILNGHTRLNFFMIYYGVCSILVHIESTVVALTSTLHSLRLTVNDYATTVICIMELYLMLHVSWLTCRIIWRKIKTPSEDVLWKL